MLMMKPFCELFMPIMLAQNDGVIFDTTMSSVKEGRFMRGEQEGIMSSELMYMGTTMGLSVFLSSVTIMTLLSIEIRKLDS